MRREDQDIVGEDPDLSGVGENLEEDSPVEESTSKQKWVFPTISRISYT